MNTSLYIARRYLFSKKTVNAINIISGISMLGVLVGSAALIIILSVFNGFEGMILSMYNTFTPELRIEPAKGKTFNPDTSALLSFSTIPQIENYTLVLEEKALLRYGESQYIAQIKGVSDAFVHRQGLDNTLINGRFLLSKNQESFAVIGSLVQGYLTVNIFDDARKIEIYSPKKGTEARANPADEFLTRSIRPLGVFQIQQQFDETVIVPLSFARELLGEEKKVSAIEVYFKPGTPVGRLHKDLQNKLGNAFIVKNRMQQNSLLYKILNTEKWAVYIILTFVLVIAVFNIIGSLTMLVIDKRKDIAVLSSIGAHTTLIRKIFFAEGMMITMIGCIAGMALGLLFSLAQQQFGFIKIGEGNIITDSYPVLLKSSDFILVFFTVGSISAITSAIASKLSVKNIHNLKEDL